MTRIRDLEITDVAFGGKGVARTDGKAVFVPYVIDGERVSASIVRRHKKFLEAELENIGAPSLHRVRPRCPYFGRCGGCVYQHIDYEHQLAVKWRQAKETLRRIGGLKEPPMRPFIASPLQYEYRNRITVHVHDGVIGFFRRESNKLLDIERCPIGLNEVNEQLAKLRASRPSDGDYTLRPRGAPRVFTQANEAVAAALLLVDDLVGGLDRVRQHRLPSAGKAPARPSAARARCGRRASRSPARARRRAGRSGRARGRTRPPPRGR